MKIFLLNDHDFDIHQFVNLFLKYFQSVFFLVQVIQRNSGHLFVNWLLLIVVYVQRHRFDHKNHHRHLNRIFQFFFFLVLCGNSNKKKND